MQRDLLLYQRALYLRKKKGYSYREIMVEIPVAKSTLSGWLSSVELSNEHQLRIRKKQEERWSRNFNLGEWNRAKRHKEVTAIRVQAKDEIGTLSSREFFITGLMLYWAEGSKSGDGVEICNADPIFVKFIMAWFRQCLGVSDDRFRAAIHYHEGQNEDRIKDFWSNLTGIPLDRFNKSFKKPPGTGHRKHYLQWGVFRVRVSCSADLFHQIAGWKDGLIENVVSGKSKGRP